MPGEQWPRHPTSSVLSLAVWLWLKMRSLRFSFPLPCQPLADITSSMIDVYISVTIRPNNSFFCNLFLVMMLLSQQEKLLQGTTYAKNRELVNTTVNLPLLSIHIQPVCRQRHRIAWEASHPTSFSSKGDQYQRVIPIPKLIIHVTVWMEPCTMYSTLFFYMEHVY